MRDILFALGLSLWLGALPALALDIEERKVFPGQGDDTLRIISTADLDVFEPFLIRFQRLRPDIGIDYNVGSSATLHRAIVAGETFDIAISSAMDLQFLLANDGHALDYRSDTTQALPAWARWRDHVFAFTAEPAVVVISADRFEGLPRPSTRQELITLLRAEPERFGGAVGTYDVRLSGLGYLFATQEARSSDAFWRLSALMGQLGAQLYCCSAQMIDDVARGDLALAYNVLGSYAAQRLARDDGIGMEILELEDFANVMLRTALIPRTAQSRDAAGAFLDALLREGMRTDPDGWVLPPLAQAPGGERLSFGPIRLGPALMVYLDPLNKEAFLQSWDDAMQRLSPSPP